MWSNGNAPKPLVGAGRYKLVQPLWKTATPRYVPEIDKSLSLHRYLHPNVLTVFICNSPKLETT